MTVTKKQIVKAYNHLRFYWNEMKKDNSNRPFDCYRSSSKAVAAFLGENQVSIWEAEDYKFEIKETQDEE